jgi:drug/metabolite transporter (DMT)-like permease
MGAAGILLISTGIFSMGKHRDKGQPKSQPKSQPKGFHLALGVGVSIVAYSLVDKLGVSHLNPVPYIWMTWTVAALVLSPFILVRYRTRLPMVVRQYSGYAAIIGAGSVGAYLMIFFAFTYAPVSYVSAIREFAIVMGVAAGFVFLGEKVTIGKVLGIVAITLGVIFVKLA